MIKIKAEDFKKACIGCGGIKSVVAQRLGVERSSVQRFLERYPQFNKDLEEAEEAIIELAENKLQTRVEAGDMKAIQFILERRAKKKYAQKQEVEQIGKDPVQLIIEYAKQDDQNPTNKETDNSDAVPNGPGDN